MRKHAHTVQCIRGHQLTELTRTQVHDTHTHGTTHARVQAFTEEEDRFLVCMTHQLGYGRWEELKYEIRKAWNFRFDWFIKVREEEAGEWGEEWGEVESLGLPLRLVHQGERRERKE